MGRSFKQNFRKCDTCHVLPRAKCDGSHIHGSCERAVAFGCAAALHLRQRLYAAKEANRSKSRIRQQTYKPYRTARAIRFRCNTLVDKRQNTAFYLLLLDGVPDAPQIRDRHQSEARKTRGGVLEIKMCGVYPDGPGSPAPSPLFSCGNDPGNSLCTRVPSAKPHTFCVPAPAGYRTKQWRVPT